MFRVSTLMLPSSTGILAYLFRRLLVKVRIMSVVAVNVAPVLSCISLTIRVSRRVLALM
jgi:hypothetical protein